MHPINIGDRNLRQLFLRDAFQTADIDPIHFADRRIVADAKRADAADFAEEVLILFGVKQVFGQEFLSSGETKTIFFSHSRPEPVATADRTIATIGALREIKLCFEADGAAVTAALVGF